MTAPDQYPEPTESDPVTRVRYFDGQFLTRDDLVVDQDHHVRNTRELATALGVRGVVRGLDVSWGPGGEVQVGHGRAVDGAGRLLHVPSDMSVPLTAAFEFVTLQVFLAYGRWPDAPVPSGSSSGDWSRWVEIPVLVVTDGDRLTVARRVDGTDASALGWTWTGGTDPVLLTGGMQLNNEAEFTHVDPGEPVGVSVPSVQVKQPADAPPGSLTVDTPTSVFRPHEHVLWTISNAVDDGKMSGTQCVQRQVNDAPSDGFLCGIVYVLSPGADGFLLMSVLDEPKYVRLAAVSVRGQGWNSFFLPVAKGTKVHMELAGIRPTTPANAQWVMEFRWTGLGDRTLPTLEPTFYPPDWGISLR